MVDEPGLIVSDVISKEIKAIRKKMGKSQKNSLWNIYGAQICELEYIHLRIKRALKKETVSDQTKPVS